MMVIRDEILIKFMHSFKPARSRFDVANRLLEIQRFYLKPSMEHFRRYSPWQVDILPAYPLTSSTPYPLRQQSLAVYIAGRV
jgi:hypothetical protein